jgi:DinB family
MPISDVLLPEFDQEMKKTRIALERVPADKAAFAPHPRSMPLGKLAPHVAQLAGFGLAVLTTPQLDFSKGSYKPLPLESAAQLVAVLDEGAAKVRFALTGLPDEAWKQNWKLLFQSDKVLFDGPRFLAYRQMFLNHIVHHRAQLGVYLRLVGQPVPATYGPSADDTLGF